MAYSILHIALATMLSYFVLVDAATIQQTMAEAHPPKAKVQNGTYVGVHNGHYNIDYFLGIPFAQPPIGNLRLAPPVSQLLVLGHTQCREPATSMCSVSGMLVLWERLPWISVPYYCFES